MSEKKEVENITSNNNIINNEENRENEIYEKKEEENKDDKKSIELKPNEEKPENENEVKEEIKSKENNEENKEENIIENPLTSIEKKEEKNVENNNKEINLDNEQEQKEEEKKEEKKIEDNYEDLDVISDKQPEVKSEEEKIEKNEKKSEKNEVINSIPFNSDIPNDQQNIEKEKEKENNNEENQINPSKEPEIKKENEENLNEVPKENDNINKENNNNFDEIPFPSEVPIEVKEEEPKEEIKEKKSEKDEFPKTYDEDKEIKEDQKPEEKPEEKNIIKYKVDYYRENLYNLLEQVGETIPLTSVPDFLKRAFAMDESQYYQDFYFKGIFPKIIISKDETGKITGMCSFYYESNEDLNNNLILRINSILVSQDYEEQIIKMFDFIKTQVDCDKIMIYILYDKIEDKFVPNVEAKNLFEKKLKFKWFCVVRDEKLKQRYIKYCLNVKKEEEYDANADNHETTKAVNVIRHNKNNFLMNNLIIASINQKEQPNLIKEYFSKKINYNKFINIYSIYFLLLQANNIKLEFKNPEMKKELQLMFEQIRKFSEVENQFGNVGASVVKNIKNIDEEMDKSIFKEIKELLGQQSIECFPNLLKTNLFINFETNFSILYNDVYYYRISSDKINILEEGKTRTKFFLIPSKDNNVLFYIAEVNNNLKKLLLDGTENVYEKFLEFQPSSQRKICEYSLKSVRDVSYIPLSFKNKCKTICIPCFSFKTHLFSYDYKGINKNITNLTERETETPLSISTVDEFINIEFKPDHNINNSFSIIEGSDLTIENSFIIGIFDNDIINNTKLPLLQFLYVTKDKFLTKKNFEFE